MGSFFLFGWVLFFSWPVSALLFWAIVSTGSHLVTLMTWLLPVISNLAVALLWPLGSLRLSCMVLMSSSRGLQVLVPFILHAGLVDGSGEGLIGRVGCLHGQEGWAWLGSTGDLVVLVPVASLVGQGRWWGDAPTWPVGWGVGRWSLVCWVF